MSAAIENLRSYLEDEIIDGSHYPKIVVLAVALREAFVEIDELHAEVERLRAALNLYADGDNWSVEAYEAFWKTYEEYPQGEGKWNSWAAALTEMFKHALEPLKDRR